MHRATVILGNIGQSGNGVGLGFRVPM